MTDQAKIDSVKLNLPAWRSDLPSWDDASIGDMLDKFEGNVNKVVRQFWLQRVNETSALTDVSDVGASRPLSQSYQHAKEMLQYWDRLANEGATATRIGKIKKRYPDPTYVGLNRYGGVYARAD